MANQGNPPVVVRAADGTKYLIDSGQRRAIRSGLLAAALEEHFGEATVADDAIMRLDESAPVELMQAPVGPPFLVAGGERLTVRGLPAVYPVEADQISAFPIGAVLDVAAANVPRARLRKAVRPATVGEVFRTAGRVAKRPFRRSRTS